MKLPTQIFISFLGLWSTCDAQESLTNTSTAQDAHTIILSTAPTKPPAFLYAASARAQVRVGIQHIDQSIELQLRVVQGQGETISLGLAGSGDVIDVTGDSIAAWAVRTAEGQRYLDLQLKPQSEQPVNPKSTNVAATVLIRSRHAQLPTRVELMHLKPGKALGFDSQIQIEYVDGVAGKMVAVEGFTPLVANKTMDRLQTSTGGRLELQLDRSSALPPAVELQAASLVGELHPSGKSVSFKLRATANVTVAGTRLRALSGNAAISQLPISGDYQFELINTDNGSEYEYVFPKAGSFPIALDFVAAINTDAANSQTLDFTVAASAVVPISLSGLAAEMEFASEPPAIKPQLVDKQWQGYLPASGHVVLKWKNARSATAGKTFFTTSSTIEATVGPGLLRQDHRLTYQVLQGQLESLTIRLVGPGEILSVEGDKIVAWKVSGEGNDRQLDVTLNQPLTAASQFLVRSQTPLGSFPVRVEGLSLKPHGAIRNSGHLRISNSGSVSVEPATLRGLTQLAPEQFPGDALQARQIFVYRFPASDFGFTLVADRVQPEINVTELVLYQLSESDRVIMADIELDIREATIRQWNVILPADYSIVAVTGASVADYMAATEAIDGGRNLKILFNQDVQGRQLVGLRLEKSEAATAGSWTLPHVVFPEAKSVRGDIGIVTAPGFRVSVGTVDLLVEKPLSYFPRTIANLQHAFRMREPGWTATMQIEQLERSVQSDTFHLLSLSQGTVYGSALINYTVTGAPVSEWQLTVPAALANVTVDGEQIRTWRRDGDTLVVSLQQPILGAYTLLVTYEDKPNVADGSFQAGQVTPLGVQGDRGFIEVVSPVQVELDALLVSSQLLTLDSLELPAEFRLLSTAPALGTWQYTQRPFDLRLKVNWFDPGTMAAQVVEFAEANSRVSQDGELVTDLLYYVKSRGQRTLKLRLPRDDKSANGGQQSVRLWSVSVDGRPVTARQAGEDTLIPLPGGADPNVPIEVGLRLGKPAQSRLAAIIELPIVFAPVLKTQWNLQADENHVLIPSGGSVEPAMSVVWPTGFDWLAGDGLVPLMAIVFMAVVGARVSIMPLRLLSLAIAVGLAASAGWYAYQQIEPLAPLQVSLPVLAAGESASMAVDNIPSWRAYASWPGLGLAVMGLVALVLTWRMKSYNGWLLWIGWGLLGAGLLMQGHSSPLFFVFLALMLLLVQFLPEAARWYKTMGQRTQAAITTQVDQPPADGNEGSMATAPILMFLISSLCVGSALTSTSAQVLAADDAQPAATVRQGSAKEIDTYQTASSLIQKWTLSSREKRLTAAADIVLSGRPGDRFMLLQSPAVLTEFKGEGLRLSKVEIPGQGTSYIVAIPAVQVEAGSKPDVEDSHATEDIPKKEFKASFQFQLDAIQPMEGVPVLTGKAALQQIDLTYDEVNMEVICESAARVETVKDQPAGTARVKILLSPGAAKILLKPQARDLASEKTQFFVEGAELYTPGPGVIDGKHRLKFRTAQGRVQTVRMVVPAELTVSAVDGPVTNWQFDADSQRLELQIDPTSPAEFVVTVHTQRSLDTLPTTAELSPLRVEGADGSVGLIALAFGSEAQPENVQSKSLSLVNLGDFDASLVTNPQTTLHRVYRYGAEGGSLTVHVAPVAPEVRVVSKQVISFGDERIVVGVNFVTEITRTGLFQLSFPLPAGMEVESLTGDALHHWSELTENNQRQIVLHLKGKTLGTQKFALALAGTAPSDAADWSVPRFELNESTRQVGELIVQPITGIRLRSIARQNISEADPRALGAKGQGALAYRLLQRDWSLQIGIEKLAPWVTGQVLHDVMLREGQTRSTLLADLTIQNAAIRSLLVKLPTLGAEEIKTLRASGETVSDLVRSSEGDNVWELRFKRRVIGPVQFQIEYERRGERPGNSESLNQVEFPDARQVAYYFAVRAGGRLEIEPGPLTQGWQRSDWSTIPQRLRESGNRQAPAIALRAMAPTTPLSLRVIRHSLADALKLRVASGTLTTILSPTGDQLTSVDLNMEVMQRSSLTVQLPTEGELFSILVNGESVHSVRQKASSNTWQFTIVPGINDRTAQVRFVYSLKGASLRSLNLVSPQLNVPLEKIEWNVIAPNGFQLTNSRGNLELVAQSSRASYDRGAYLSRLKDKREGEATQAAKLLEHANQLLQSGEQSKAQWVFSNVANRYALDAASNEDARVQLENLQTQQAIVGLNTRRQRLFLDSNRSGGAATENEQLLQAAAVNPVLQQEQLNYRPQELSQLLAGNSKEDNANLQQIAGRLVQHQRTTEPAPQAIVISMPEDGHVYSFRRSVQVAENAPLELQLHFHSQYQLRAWQWAILVCLIGLLAAGLAFGVR